MKALDITRPG